MKAMVLAAGEGRRLHPLTEQVLKPMVPLGGRPLLAYTIEALAKHGFQELVVNLHHCPDVVRDYFGDGADWHVRIQYSPEDRLRGTAGALAPWRRFFDSTCLVVYGDNLSTCDLTRLMRVHRDRRAEVTVALFWREDPWQSGVAELDDADRITRFVEKPSAPQVPSRWVNAGLIVLEPTLLDDIPDHAASDFGRELLPKWIANGRRVYGYRMSPQEKLWWIDTPEDMARVQRELNEEVPN